MLLNTVSYRDRSFIRNSTVGEAELSAGTHETRETNAVEALLKSLMKKQMENAFCQQPSTSSALPQEMRT